MNLGLENLASLLGTVEATPEGIAFELFDAAISYDAATEEFDIALESLDRAELYIEQLGDLRVAVEKYGVDEIVGVIGAEAMLAAVGTISGQEAFVAAAGNKFALAYQTTKKYLMALIDKLISWVKQAVLYFDGSAKRMDALAAQIEAGKLTFAEDSATTLKIYNNTVFGARLEALEKGDVTDMKTLATPGVLENGTLSSLKWDEAGFKSYVGRMVTLLATRKGLLAKVDEVKKANAQFDTETKDDKLDDAGKIAKLKEQRAAVVGKIKEVNLRIKEINILSKQVFMVAKAAAGTEKVAATPATPA